LHLFLHSFIFVFCVVLRTFFLRVFTFLCPMTPISSVMPMLFPLPWSFCLLVNLYGVNHSTSQVFDLGPFQFASWICLVDNIRIMGILFGFSYFLSSFLQKDLDEDVHHANVLSRLRDVQVAFQIFFWCFVQMFFYVLYWFSCFLCFQCQLAIFNSAMLGLFDRLLGPGSLECS
jgi:hypothetical protein